MSFEQIIYSPSLEIPTQNQTFNINKLNLLLSYLGELNHIVRASIQNSLYTNTVIGFETNLPNQMIATLDKLYQEGTSKFDPKLKNPSTYNPKSDKSQIITELSKLRATNTEFERELTGGKQIIEMLQNQYPNFADLEFYLGQGSASKKCPNGYDIETAKRLVDQNFGLIMGGTGMPGSVMENFCKTYLENGGKFLVIVIPKSLTKPVDGKTIIHSEKPFFTNEFNVVEAKYRQRAVVLEVDDLDQRLGLFHYLTSQGKTNFGKVGIKYGGVGTFAEKLALRIQNQICPDFGTFRDFQVSQNGLWDESDRYLKNQFNI